MSRAIRLMAICVLSSVGLWAGTVGAAAAKPDRQTVPQPPDFTIDFCGPAVGPINVHGDFHQHSTIFVAKDGTIRTTFNGSITTTLTTTAGKSVVLNTSGPGTITEGPNGISVVGRGLNIVGNETGLWIYAGHIEIDPNTGLILSHSGRITDVCQMLM